MRGKIRLDGRKHVETDKGFPVVIYLTKDRKEKLILTGYHSKKEHWDKANALPLKTHPNYTNIINYLEIKKIKLGQLLDKAKYEVITLQYAEYFLKGEETGVFYNDASRLDLSRTQMTALKSFQKYYPDYPYSYITNLTAKDFIDKLMATKVNGKQRSPNGVFSYMNSLTAIWNKLGKDKNPFSGVRPKTVKTKNKALSVDDLIKLRDNDYLKHKNSKGGGISNYINYLLLCFYLGGIDLVDLANLKHSNIINGRIEFNRSKTGTFISNKIFPEAQNLLDMYKCKPYLVPLMKDNNYDNFIPNISRNLKDIKEKLELSKLPYSKAPRYTFITRGQNLLIDERCVMALVGHSQNTIHSIYKDEFPESIKDEAHKKIISF